MSTTEKIPDSWYQALEISTVKELYSLRANRQIIDLIYGGFPKFPPNITDTGEVRAPNSGECYIWRKRYEAGEVASVAIAGNAFINRNFPAIIVKMRTNT